MVYINLEATLFQTANEELTVRVARPWMRLVSLWKPDLTT